MRPLAIALFLLAAVPAFAAIELAPPAPTDESYVVLQVREPWSNVCLPRNPQVSRNGNRIDVAFTVQFEVGCFNRVNFWSADVPLGVLPAGAYDVVVSAPPVNATVKLVVTDATPPVIVEPPVLSSLVPTDVRVSVPGSCLQDGAVVLVDGVTVPSRSDGCSATATFPAHPPGAVDVTARILADEHTTVAAVRYIDPEATPDPSLFERVLIPVFFNGPGAFGSQWATEVVMVNRSPRPLRWLPRVSGSLPPIPADATVSLEGIGNHLTGLVLFLPRGYDVRFAAVFRDVSREASQWGTELPIVREDEFEPTVTLPNVPFDPRYRLQLRIYGIDGHSFRVHVAPSSSESREITVAGACTRPNEPCNSRQPAFASVDLGAAFPQLAGRQQIRISPATFDFTRKIWAFVTVTNNETQQVTVMTPQ